MTRPGHAFPRAGARPAATRTQVLALLALVALAASCGKDDSPTAPAPTPAELVAGGWSQFERGAYAGAQGDFEAALAQDAAYGPAHLGRAWSLLVRAGAAADYETAEAAFDSAMAHQETSAAVWAGRAAARLGRGGDALAGAATDAEQAIARDPAFSFAHLAGFDAADARLMLAQARAGLGDFAGALVAVQPDCPIDLRPDDPAGWTVAGTSYDSYASAVLAWLQQTGAIVAP